MRLDIYRRLPKDLTEPTFCGAFLSVLCTLFLACLCLSEVSRYLQVGIQTEMLVDYIA